MSIDDSKLRASFQAIHGEKLTREEATAIVAVARLAASADGKMDLGEMGVIAQLSSILFAMAGEPNAPVPAQPAGPGWLLEIGTQLEARGPRELAYAAAMLVMHSDRKLTQTEGALGAQLAEVLLLEMPRARELDGSMKLLVS